MLFVILVQLIPMVLSGLGISESLLEYWYLGLDAMLHWLILLLVLGFCWARFSGTPGLLLLGCQVVGLDDGRPIALKPAMIRSFALVPSLALMLIGVLWIGWDKRKQGWHDKFARTVVVPEGGYSPDDESGKSLAQLLKEMR